MVRSIVYLVVGDLLVITVEINAIEIGIGSLDVVCAPDTRHLMILR